MKTGAKRTRNSLDLQEALAYMKDHRARFKAVAENAARELAGDKSLATVIDFETAFYRVVRATGIIEESGRIADYINQLYKEHCEAGQEKIAISLMVQRRGIAGIKRRKIYLPALLEKLADPATTDDDVRLSLFHRTIIEGSQQLGYRSALEVELETYLDGHPESITGCFSVFENWIRDESRPDHVRITAIDLYQHYRERLSKPGLFEAMPETMWGMIYHSPSEQTKQRCWIMYEDYLRNRIQAGTLEKKDYEPLIAMASDPEAFCNNRARRALAAIDPAAYQEVMERMQQ